MTSAPFGNGFGGYGNSLGNGGAAQRNQYLKGTGRGKRKSEGGFAQRRAAGGRRWSS